MSYKTNKAFTLIEVLFTLAIITIAAIAIARSSMNNITAVNKNQLRLNALNLAQAKLVEIIDSKDFSQNESGKETINNIEYNWRCGITENTIADNQNKTPLLMQCVSVTTSWLDNTNREQSLTVRQYLCPGKE